MTKMPPVIDYAASPTLTEIRSIAGDAAVTRLVAERGGTWVHVPMRLTVRAELVQIVGAEAARAIIQHFGGGAALRIPTGRGFAHGRRLDHAEIVRLHAPPHRWSIKRLALAMGCTDRQILKILAAARDGAEDGRQANLFPR